MSAAWAVALVLSEEVGEKMALMRDLMRSRVQPRPGESLLKGERVTDQRWLRWRKITHLTP